MITWMQITSGRGPAECCWVVTQLVQCITRDAERNNIKVRLLETVPHEKPNTLRSALLALEGDSVSDFSSQYNGTVQWIGTSLFRPRHKRKNWFVGVSCLVPPASTQWAEKEIRFEKMRSSGPGGQHANKTETAIRATHLPSGLSAYAQEERSQYLNRKLAISRLFERLEEQQEKEHLQSKKKRWNRHNQLERGNPARIYEGENFKLKNL